VVAGELRGRRIEVAAATRPTIDRLRPAIFASLGVPPPARVRDCYAGSGPLGIAALSRGADSTSLIERADVLRSDLAAAGPFGLVLADPPYADDPWIQLLERLAEPGVVSGDGLIVAEFSARRVVPDVPPKWCAWKTRRHGDGAFAVYRRSRNGESDDHRTSL